MSERIEKFMDNDIDEKIKKLKSKKNYEFDDEGKQEAKIAKLLSSYMMKKFKLMENYKLLKKDITDKDIQNEAMEILGDMINSDKTLDEIDIEENIENIWNWNTKSS